MSAARGVATLSARDYTPKKYLANHYKFVMMAETYE
jgi:hypothetical protein